MALKSPNKRLALPELQGRGEALFATRRTFWLREQEPRAVTVRRRQAYMHEAHQPVRRAVSAAAATVPIGHATNFHLVLHAVYKNPPDAKLDQLQLLEELTLQRLDELNVDSLITVMFAFARSRYPPHPAIQHRMAAATEADMRFFTPRQLEHAAWSLAAVSYRPSEGWLDGFAQALQVNWDAFRPSQLAITLVQAAACGLTRLPAATLLHQMPALLRRLSDSSADTPGTLSKLVWCAGHFEPATTTTATAAGPAPALAPAAPADAAQPAADPAGGAWRPAPGAAVPVLPERELLGWWEGEGVVEAAEPGDLVLLLNGLARLGVRPGAALTRRLLAAVMGSPGSLAQLGPPQLALLAWSALKLTPGEPPRREWLDGLVAAMRGHIAATCSDGAASGIEAGAAGRGPGPVGCVAQGAGAEDCGFSAARPADVALVLSSLAGLGGQLPAGRRGEFSAYWRSGGHWAALSGEDRVVMSLLGYGPGPGAGAGAGD